MIKLMATDLDGTLLRSDGTISDRTRCMLRNALTVGITIVLVSARPPRTLRVMAEQIGLTGIAICCNGAIVYDLESDRIVRHQPIRIEVAQQLVASLREVIPGVCFALELGLRYGWEPAYAKLNPQSGQKAGVEGDALDLCTEPVTKLIVRHGELSIDELLAATRTVAGNEAHVTHSGAPFVEISAAGVQKAWALQTLCDELAIKPDEVIAFGDMPNDLPMLEWAGRSVVVANAHPEALEQADEITASNDEDGVALIIEREQRVANYYGAIATGSCGPRTGHPPSPENPATHRHL